MSRDTTYAALVRAYRDWAATHDRRALDRIEHAKDTLMAHCGGMTHEYVALWELAKARGEQSSSSASS